MRYGINENTTLLGKFTVSATVSITLYELPYGSVVALSSNTCNQIMTTGIFAWNTGNMSVRPSALTEYLYVMTDASANVVEGKIVFGGIFDNVDSKVDDLWRIEGLDSSNPLIVTQTSRAAGASVQQSISGDPSASVTVSRV